MALRERIKNAVAAFQDAKLPLAPLPSMVAPMVRMDSDAPAKVARQDGTWNSFTGFGGVNDKGAVARPSFRQGLLYWELDIAYNQNGMPRRIVDIWADDTTAEGWNVDGEKDRNCMIDEDRRLNTWQRIGDARRWSALYGHGTVLMVTTEEGDPPLDEPLDLSKLISVDNLVDLDGYEGRPALWNGDLKSPNVRCPEIWYVQPRTISTVDARYWGARVHASRILHIRNWRKPNTYQYDQKFGEGIDISCLIPTWDQIRNYEAVQQASGIMANEMRLDIMTVANNAGKGASDTQADYYTRVKQIALYRSLLNMILLGEGEKYETRNGVATGYKELDEGSRRALSAVSKIPQVRLYGDTPSGLNTDGASWQQMWAREVHSDQRQRLYRPLIQLYTALFMAKKGPFKGKVPKSWDLTFNPIYRPTQAEIADVRLKNAQADQAYVGMGLDPEHVFKSRFTDTGYGDEILPYVSVIPELEDPAKAEASRNEIRALVAEAVKGKAALKGAGQAGQNEPGPEEGGNQEGGGSQGSGEPESPSSTVQPKPAE